MSFNPFSPFAPFGGGSALPTPEQKFINAQDADGPIARWRGNDATGTVLVDDVGGRNGTKTGSFTVVTGPLGADAYQRVSSAEVEMATSTELDLVGYGTMETWAQFQYASNTYLSVIGTGYRAGWSLFGDCRGPAGRVSFGWRGTGSFSEGFAGNHPVDKWLHLVLTWSPTLASLYVNNIGAGTIPIVSVAPSGGPLKMFGYTQSGYLPVALAYTALYPFVLPAERIAAHYAAAQP